MAPTSKGTLTWVVENEARWLQVECAGHPHRVRVDVKEGMYFEQHRCGAEMLRMESSFLHPVEWSGCYTLSRWFCGELRWAKGVAVPRADGPTVIVECQFSTGAVISLPEPGVPEQFKVVLEGEPMAVSLLRRFVYSIEDRQVPFTWLTAKRWVT